MRDKWDGMQTIYLSKVFENYGDNIIFYISIFLFIVYSLSLQCSPADISN